jgi:hypothetical protein
MCRDAPEEDLGEVGGVKFVIAELISFTSDAYPVNGYEPVWPAPTLQPVVDAKLYVPLTVFEPAGFPFTYNVQMFEDLTTAT